MMHKVEALAEADRLIRRIFRCPVTCKVNLYPLETTKEQSQPSAVQSGLRTSVELPIRKIRLKNMVRSGNPAPTQPD